MEKEKTLPAGTEKKNFAPLHNPGLVPGKGQGVIRQAKIKVYDFKRPDKFSKDQIRTVAIMHETFARLSSTSLSAALRSLAHMHVAAVDQLTYEEFIRSLPNPAALSIINMDPLMGSAVLEIDPALTFTMIDRLFGGTGKALIINRELKDMETAVLENIITILLGNIRAAWSGVIDLHPRLGQIETNPQFAQIVPPTEMVMLVSLDAHFGEAKGMINFCIPYLTIEPVIGKLNAQYWYSSARKGAKQTVASVPGLKMDSVLYYEGEKLGLDVINKLKKGSCIKLPGYAHQEAFLENGGATVLKLRREKAPGREGYCFSTGKTENLPVNAVAELLPGKAEGGESGSNLRNILSAAISDFMAGLNESITTLHKGIGEIQKKQDLLADQIFFEAAGNGSPVQGEADNSKQKPFGFITMQNRHNLGNCIRQEHPQVAALILSYLPPEVAGQLLMDFAPDIQVELTERIACLDKVSLDVLQTTERILKRKMDMLSATDYWQAGGIKGVVNILNLAPRSLEKHIIETLDNCNAELSEEIKMRMFVFEDVVLLDKKAMQKVISHVKKEDLAIALKKTDSQVTAYIHPLLTKEELTQIQQIQEARSPLRVTDIEEAQQRIVGRIRELEEKGEIIVARPGETV